MMERDAVSLRILQPARLALCAGAVLFYAGSAPTPASAQQSTTAAVLGALGLAPSDAPDIDYRERAPLVVPPSAQILPPPRDKGEIAANPAWPKDYDDQQRKKQAELEASLSHNGDISPNSKVLSPSEMARGRRAGANPRGPADDNNGKPVSPSALGFTGWGNLFGTGGSKDKALVFNGEPDREALVQPPVGYQTPAPNAPYGTVEEKKQSWSLPNWFDRATGTKD